MKALLLVIDGLGVGAMDDAEEQGFPPDANTLRHVAEEVGGLSLPALAKLGLGNVLAVPGIPARRTPESSCGQARLGYQGADSYLGHQEILGTIPESPTRALLGEVSDGLVRTLEAKGYRVSRPISHAALLLVNDAVVVGDNLEAAPGQAINVTVPTAAISFADALQIGHVVRAALRHSRVIVCGGPSVRVAELLSCVELRSDGRAGINTPKLGIYDGDYAVRHLGYGGDPARQLVHHYRDANEPVALFGKMADLIQGEVTTRSPIVDTVALLAAAEDWLRDNRDGLLALTVQETDLAGHEQDATRFAEVLSLIDSRLPSLLEALDLGDILAITADHGNDPLLGGGQHSRERVPMIWHEVGSNGSALGLRDSLADIAASIALKAGFRWAGDGSPFLDVGIPTSTSQTGGGDEALDGIGA